MNDVATQLFQLPERVRFDNAESVRGAGERFLDKVAGAAEFSLGALRESNSVVVALLLAWVRHARARGIPLRFVAIPADLRNIIELYGVADILPLEAGDTGSTWTVEDEDDPAAGPDIARD